MLKKRVVPLLLWSGGKLRKTKQFDEGVVVGDSLKTSRLFSDQQADEIMLLNIDDSVFGKDLFLETVSRIAREIMMPLSVGGKVRSFNDARKLFEAGADKIVMNTIFFEDPVLARAIVASFGSQAVVAGVDYKLETGSEKGMRLFSDRASRARPTSVSAHLHSVSLAGAGEVMLQSIDRDGSQTGYDLESLVAVRNLVEVPLTIAGGARDFSDLKAAFDLGADAAACGSLFYFGDNNPLRAKSYLANKGIMVRNHLQFA